MIPALTIQELKEKVKGKGNHEAVVGIMMGRYNVKEIKSTIDDSYIYWHLNSGREFDIYWAGYGEYYGTRSENQFILECADSCNGAYFDLDAFVTFKNDFTHSKNIPYHDKLQLILCNVRNGDIIFDEHLIINLEENFDNPDVEIRDIMENIIELCKNETTVNGIKQIMRPQSFWEKVRGISFSDIITLTSTVAGIASSLT